MATKATEPKAAEPAPTEPAVTKPAKAAKRQGKNDTYYLVNPAGAIHSASKEHARVRLRVAGWRLAEEAEIDGYLAQKIQRHDRPICARWSPDPDEQLTELDA